MTDWGLIALAVAAGGLLQGSIGVGFALVLVFEFVLFARKRLLES